MPEAVITVVDKVPLPRTWNAVTTIQADGVSWLAQNFTTAANVSRIIPALPIHLAAEWLKQVLTTKGYGVDDYALPDALLEALPNPYLQNPSQTVVSHADFLCPETCMEPEKTCTATGKPRPTPLHHLIENMDHPPFSPLVLRSRQFAPGVGGFFPQDLRQLLQRAVSATNHPLLIATACKCHGVISGMLVTVKADTLPVLDNL